MVGDPEYRNPMPEAEAPAKSKPNGYISISSKGIAKFAFDGPEGKPMEPFSVDVIGQYNHWAQIDTSFREPKDGEMVVPPGQQVAWMESRRAFVQALVNEAYAPLKQKWEANGGEEFPLPILSHAEAAEFMARLTDEVSKLQVFFEPLTPGTSSSAPSTGIRFSQ